MLLSSVNPGSARSRVALALALRGMVESFVFIDAFMLLISYSLNILFTSKDPTLSLMKLILSNVGFTEKHSPHF